MSVEEQSIDADASVHDEDADLDESNDEKLGGETESENDESENGGKLYDGRISHFRNHEAHPLWLRFGIPLYLLGTLGLLLASDIGCGIEANYILRRSNGSVFEERTLLTASIFSSVKELWNSGSYALALLIAITSIAWPYIKLALSLAAWVLPVYKSPICRERLIEIVDALGKWSFVDIFVLLIIMVAFRATIPLASGVTVDVVVVPLWGFFGFVIATMLSLLGTHLILYRHRRLLYESEHTTENGEHSSGNENDEAEKKCLAYDAVTSKLLLVVIVVIGLALHIAGSILYIYEVTNTDSQGSVLVKEYSFVNVGTEVAYATFGENQAGIRFIQVMYFALGLALPIWNGLLWMILYLWPMKAQWHQMMFFLSEITFSWSAMEVFVVSTIFAVLQLPTFGNGLIDAGCEQCYVVGTSIKPEFAILVIASVWNVVVSIFLYQKAHTVLHGPAEKCCSSCCGLCMCCSRLLCKCNP